MAAFAIEKTLLARFPKLLGRTAKFLGSPQADAGAVVDVLSSQMPSKNLLKTITLKIAVPSYLL
jgi:hypothetical protein